MLGSIFENLGRNVLFTKLPIMKRKVGVETSSEPNSDRKRMYHCKCLKCVQKNEEYKDVVLSQNVMTITV